MDKVIRNYIAFKARRGGCCDDCCCWCLRLNGILKELKVNVQPKPVLRALEDVVEEEGEEPDSPDEPDDEPDDAPDDEGTAGENIVQLA